jgi:carbon storage regulator
MHFDKASNTRMESKMLVLSRKKDQTIVFQTSEGNIEFTIVKIENNRVRVGINAPPNIPILRSELLQKEEITPTN